MSCSVCLEDYDQFKYIPMILNPCGHGVCQICIENWGQVGGNSCPECREKITSKTINRNVLDMLNKDTVNDIENKTTMFTTNDLDRVRNNDKDIIKDKSVYSFIVIDNSGSMQIEDGKKFYYDKDSKIVKFQYISRWDEAVHKLQQVINYNLSRDMVTNYYLLNPKVKGKWVEKVDYIEIDPTDSLLRIKLDILKTTILSSNNIRRSTPLHTITSEFNRYLSSLEIKGTVCYNLITDGEPDDRGLFELKIRDLCHNHDIFMVINLCTDNNNVVRYYNNLDSTIGNEISGLDVIDDFENELGEILECGNDFFVYSLDIHVARMSGCYSIAADLLDEQLLNISYINKLTREILKINDSTLNILDKNNYLQQVQKLNDRKSRVYDYSNKKFCPPINMDKLKHRLYPGKKEICVIV